MSEMLELDGNIGGGSVLRVGVPLAIALNKPLHITNVRKQRTRRGVQTQHLTGLQLIAGITGSQIVGANIGSTEIFVTPSNNPIDPSFLPQVNIPSSGAVSLVFQTLSNYIFATRQKGGFAFNGGGSHVNYSPNFDVLTHVNAPLFRMFGIQTHIMLEKAGFYPSGGAIGKFFMEPVDFGRVNLEGGEISEHLVISNASTSLKMEKVAERAINGYKKVLTPSNTMFGYAPADNKGAAISSIVKYETGSVKSVAGIYESKESPEELGKRTANMAREEINSKAAVDEQLADQLIVPLAFSPKGSSYTFTKRYPHIKTNLHVVEAIMGEIFEVTQVEDYYRIERI